MKKITIALFGSIALFGLQGVAAAQTNVTRMAYDQCRADAGFWDVVCSLAIVIDGYDTVVANGVGPQWSPDGSRIGLIRRSMLLRLRGVSTA